MGGKGGGKSAAARGYYKGYSAAKGQGRSCHAGGSGRSSSGRASFGSTTDCHVSSSSSQPITRYFAGWPLYFRGESEPDRSDERFRWAHDVLTALKDEQVVTAIGFDPAEAERSGRVKLDRKTTGGLSGFAEAFRRLDGMPDVVLACLGVAFYESALRSRTEANPVVMRKIAVRIQCDVVSPIRDIKSQTIGKFVSVCGTVVRVSAIRPLVTSIAFVCEKCGERMTCTFNDGKYGRSICRPSFLGIHAGRSALAHTHHAPHTTHRTTTQSRQVRATDFVRRAEMSQHVIVHTGQVISQDNRLAEDPCAGNRRQARRRPHAS